MYSTSKINTWIHDCLGCRTLDRCWRGDDGFACWESPQLEHSQLAELLHGKVALRALCHQEVKVAQILFQNISLVILPCGEKYLAKMHTNHVRKNNLIFLPLLRLVGKASAHVRTVSFLHSLGNEKQSGDSVSSLTWLKIRCTGEHNLRVCKERERAMNTWIWWERPKSPAPQKSITGHKSLERENRRRRKYPLRVEMRKEEVTKQT